MVILFDISTSFTFLKIYTSWTYLEKQSVFSDHSQCDPVCEETGSARLDFIDKLLGWYPVSSLHTEMNE